ncbi:MAG: hypothetical protein KDI79_30515, partial [Anaerolineae bacterium]|nr:hypothetical protein [Anaerolineae bacterium]
MKHKPINSTKVLNWIVGSWLSVEIGQFAETRLPWGHNELFWPLWIAISAGAALTIKLIDLQDEICCPDDEDTD